ncbi:hypothetical protein [Streptomyces sp. NPDC015242]|uniref:hypothetical protein n=1 Tax=Streptomyces sp. NPDC015242 TaxID=3364951 RepID=UPI0036F8AF74
MTTHPHHRPLLTARPDTKEVPRPQLTPHGPRTPDHNDNDVISGHPTTMTKAPAHAIAPNRSGEQ